MISPYLPPSYNLPPQQNVHARMVFACHHRSLAVAVLLLVCGLPDHITGNTITTAPQATSIATTAPATCEFRTINYITDSLPQLCGKSSWSSTIVTSTTRIAEISDVKQESIENISSSSSDVHDQNINNTESDNLNQEATIPSKTASSASIPHTSTAVTEDIVADVESGELNDASFLSFEEWKKQTLEKAGQPNVNIGHKKSGEKKRDSESIQNNLDSLGDEGEINLDFGAFGSGSKGEEPSTEREAKDTEAQQDVQNPEGAARQYRSKDAGKTCKERFSYASFDAGATILKTHAGAKNSKAVLIENKDSYMLSECSTDNKFLIIELSEDIWIDTLVLANYEFFSSMIRSFRVSVSDRYPVKMEKWKDLGTYEARNSREIQAFLIENPQIWARYIRIEFLSHYGNEYYCPLSLVRVHGTRMLESWKETEAIGEDDDAEDNDDQNAEEQFVPDAVADVVQEEERLSAELKEAQAAIQELIKTAEVVSSDRFETDSSQLVDVNQSQGRASFQSFSSWIKPSSDDGYFALHRAQATCPASDAPISESITFVTQTDRDVKTNLVVDSAHAATSAATITSTSDMSVSSPMSSTSQSTEVASKSNTMDSFTTSTGSARTGAVSDVHESTTSTTVPVTNKQNVTSSKNRTTSTSSASSPLPTIQESFFKAVSRRLQLLETNSTLSLKYIEEQSRILREAFSKIEKKQFQKTNAFLDNLNSTVLAELRVFRQQYDEIWQSTVISLESQREESRREILAISARLNILADEVVFQKRMSIVQSILLLLCLGLVIFSRVSAVGQPDLHNIHSRTRTLGFPASLLESPLESPQYHGTHSRREAEQWSNSEYGRKHSDGSPISRSCSRGVSPPTPISTCSDSAFTPPSGGEDLSGSTHLPTTSEYLQLPLESRDTNPISMQWQGEDNTIEQFPVPSSSPTRTPRKRKGFMRQQGTPGDQAISFEESQIRGDMSSQEEITSRSSPLASPPQKGEKSRFGIARKPLPALPTDVDI